MKTMEMRPAKKIQEPKKEEETKTGEAEPKLTLDEKILKDIEEGRFRIEELEEIDPQLHKAIALKFIETEQCLAVVYNLQKFEGLDKEVALKLIEARQGRAVAENAGSFKIARFENDLAFNTLLEAIEAEDELLKNLFTIEAFKDDPIKHLYIIRMLLLFPEKYQALQNYLKENHIETRYFDEYEDEIKDLREDLNKIGKEPLDQTEPSFNLEIESQNLDNILEIDTNITNNPQEIVDFVKKMDKVQEKIRADIKARLPMGRHLVGVYDSVHLNIGLNKKETIQSVRRTNAVSPRTLFSLRDFRTPLQFPWQS